MTTDTPQHPAGTIAMVTSLNRRDEWRAMYDGKTWREIQGTFVGGFCVDTPTTVRPLVVIDPEDREQVEQLAKAMHESDHIAPWHDLHNETRSQIDDAMQAALREFANPTPPRPEEPTRLGAVVEDAAGVLWVRAGKSHNGRLTDNWRQTDGNGVGNWQPWSRVAAVRVLSEGVTP